MTKSLKVSLIEFVIALKDTSLFGSKSKKLLHYMMKVHPHSHCYVSTKTNNELCSDRL